jgi:aspartate aminotransferase
MDNYQSISNFCPEKTIISTGLSKWCGAGGWRLGYFLVPDSLNEIKNMINVLASETFSAVSAPIQYAAIKAYEHDHSNYINKSKNILSAIGNYVYENLRSNKVLINKPQGGFYLMPEFLNKKFNSSSEMCDSILNDTGVALLPGSDFGFEQTKMLARLSFTDFDGQEFMNKIEDNQKIDKDHIAKFAPKIIEGVDKLKKWSESI